MDTNEQFNISRDDALSYPEVTHIEYPQVRSALCLAFSSSTDLTWICSLSDHQGWNVCHEDLHLSSPLRLHVFSLSLHQFPSFLPAHPPSLARTGPSSRTSSATSSYRRERSPRCIRRGRARRARPKQGSFGIRRRIRARRSPSGSVYSSELSLWALRADLAFFKVAHRLRLYRRSSSHPPP